MKVLLTGALGQLGWCLRQQIPPGLELIPSCRSGGQGLLALDLSDPQACRQAVLKHQPDWVVNCGAYTAVDKAETEPDLVHAVNVGAPHAFAEALAQTGGQLLQLSTDYVFNGDQAHPYQPDDARHPLGVYGVSKAAAEDAVVAVLGTSGRGLVLRTSWLMSPVGHNFALTMLRLHRDRARTGQVLSVVDDQVSSPTSGYSLAAVCWRLVLRSETSRDSLGAFVHWSDAGVASWYDVAVAIGALGVELGLLDTMATVEPIPSAAFPTLARRPHYSVLDCTQTRAALQVKPVHWQRSLRCLIKAMV